MFSPFDPFQAALLLALHQAGSPRAAADLAVVSGRPEQAVAGMLQALAREGVVSRNNQGLWHSPVVPGECVRHMAETLRERLPATMPAHFLGHLGPDAGLDGCEHVLAHVDKALAHDRPGALLCLEFALHFLLRWENAELDDPGQSSQYVELALAAQSMCMFQQRLLDIAVRLAPIAYAMTVRYGNERFRPLVSIFNAYLGIFRAETLPRDAVLPPDSLDETVAYADAEIRSVVPLFSGLLHYVRGEYGRVVSHFERKKDSYPWQYRRISELFDSCASQSAFYLGRYHISLGIIESRRGAAERANDPELSLFWLLHLVFAQLRMGDPATALPNLDCLFLSASATQFNKTANSAVRGLALYHYLSGDTRAAHTVMRSHIGHAVRGGLPHVPFEDPIILDMLYAFERAGYAPVPRYELAPTLKKISVSPNRHLRGAGLRVQALLALDKGRPLHHAVKLLEESIDLLTVTEEPRETALARYVLATILERTGKAREAARHRDLLPGFSVAA